MEYGGPGEKKKCIVAIARTISFATEDAENAGVGLGDSRGQGERQASVSCRQAVEPAGGEHACAQASWRAGELRELRRHRQSWVADSSVQFSTGPSGNKTCFNICLHRASCAAERRRDMDPGKWAWERDWQSRRKQGDSENE